MPSFNVLTENNNWVKAKALHYLNADGGWVKGKKAWVLDANGTWQLAFVSEKYVELAIDFDLAEFHHDDWYTSWGAAKQGYYQGKERTGYLFPHNAGSWRDYIQNNVPDFGSLVRVDFASFAINRGGSGDWGSNRTLRLKQTTKTSLTGPDAVNGYCDFTVSGGQGWKWDLQNGLQSYSNCLKDTVENCINRAGGANNIIINSDNEGYGSNGWNWSYDYMSVVGAKMNIGITYEPR